jgi:hypothetical protein
MSGVALTTTSPSSSKTTRSTPWVLGCWGPMLRIMVLLSPISILLHRPGDYPRSG